MEITAKNAIDAMRLKQLLRDHGIRAHVSKRSGENGCYYYLNVSEKRYPRIVEILDRLEL